MIQVNLYQPVKKAKKVRPKVDPTKPLILFAMFAIVAAAGIINFHFYAKVKGIRLEIRRIDNQMNNATFVADLEKANTLQLELDKLNRKANIIDDLITKRIHWSKKLAAVRDVLPEDIWIERIELADPTNPKDNFQTLSVDAATVHVARGMARIAETIDRLRESEDFMEGFYGDIEDRRATAEPWDKTDMEGIGATAVWRFTVQARRELPQAESTSR